MTLTPMLCSRFLRVNALHARGRFAGFMERMFNATYRGYERSLRLTLRHRPIMLAIFVGVLVATVRMFVIVPKGFIPDQDNDSMNINLRAAQGTSYYDMVKNARQVAEIVSRNPCVDTFFVSTGGGTSAMNTARLNIQLTPRRNRPLTAAQVAQQLRPQLSRFPGFQAFISLPPAIQIGGRQANSSYTLTVESADSANLFDWAARLEREIVKRPELQDVPDDMEVKSPRVDLVVDRDAAAAVGVNVSDIENTLYDGFGPQWATTIYGSKAQYKVLLELDPKDQEQTDALKKISFKSSSMSRSTPSATTARTRPTRSTKAA